MKGKLPFTTTITKNDENERKFSTLISTYIKYKATFRWTQSSSSGDLNMKSLNELLIQIFKRRVLPVGCSMAGNVMANELSSVMANWKVFGKDARVASSLSDWLIDDFIGRYNYNLFSQSTAKSLNFEAILRNTVVLKLSRICSKFHWFLPHTRWCPANFCQHSTSCLQA